MIQFLNPLLNQFQTSFPLTELVKLRRQSAAGLAALESEKRLILPIRLAAIMVDHLRPACPTEIPLRTSEGHLSCLSERRELAYKGECWTEKYAPESITIQPDRFHPRSPLGDKQDRMIRRLCRCYEDNDQDDKTFVIDDGVV